MTQKRRQLKKKKSKYNRYGGKHGWVCADGGAGSITTCRACLSQAGRTRNAGRKFRLLPF